MFRTALKPIPAAPTAMEAYAIPLLRPDKWIEAASEGELTVDVYETHDAFVVQSTVAGVTPDALSLAIHRDLLTIRGTRNACAPHAERTYLVEECFWGNFSRSIVLPEPVDVPRSHAEITHGILTVTLPKLQEQSHIAIAHTDAD